MNWKIIFSLSLFGVLMGVASLFGYTQGIELYLWLAIAIISTLIISKSGGKIFLTGVIAGLFMEILNCIIHAIFIDMYVANNRELIAQMSDGPFEYTAGFALLIAVPTGLIYGLFIGLLAWIFSKFMRKPAEA